ncbi:MAG: hypothetical protein NC115_06105 [Bacteroidales bacterium]|nr:hypothetical protein [Bacteroides sp.]MCM1197561.1 hypothetical protein [Clostridium sp.]MCM1502223.1 hypothetical protein [Bacteroidales bacterium]
MVSAKLPDKGKGYSGEVAFGDFLGLNANFSQFSFYTTHGYSFGKGGFIGLGTGLLTDFSESIAVPLYAKWSYTFDTDNKVRPYLGSSIGLCANEDLDVSAYIAPEFGVRLGRFFFNVQYSFYDFLSDEVYVGNNLTLAETRHYHTLSFGIGISF